jgi:hypothetical protein
MKQQIGLCFLVIVLALMCAVVFGGASLTGTGVIFVAVFTLIGLAGVI